MLFPLGILDEFAHLINQLGNLFFILFQIIQALAQLAQPLLIRLDREASLSCLLLLHLLLFNHGEQVQNDKVVFDLKLYLLDHCLLLVHVDLNGVGELLDKFLADMGLEQQLHVGIVGMLCAVPEIVL